MDALKLEIKHWEHQFKKKNGRNPTKDDIKSNKEIANKYKEYQNYRSHPKNPIKHESKVMKTPTKKRRAHQLNTPQKTSPLKPESSPILLKEIGPTPQLNGRVLSIFDSITSPNETPIKREKGSDSKDELDFELKSTPVKRLNFSRMMEDYVDEDEINSDDENTRINEEKENKENLNSIFKTPQKMKQVDIAETPAYLKTSQSSVMMSASPSPLASQRMRKGLSTLIDELRDIQDELKYGDFDRDALIPVEEVPEEDDEPVSEDDGKIWKKKKTQKRQTRRVKMKARKVSKTDGMADKDVHQEIKRLEQEKEELLKDLEDDLTDNDASEDELYVRQPLDPEAVKSARPKERKNFVKLKINKKKGFFGRRSRW